MHPHELSPQTLYNKWFGYLDATESGVKGVKIVERRVVSQKKQFLEEYWLYKPFHFSIASRAMLFCAYCKPFIEWHLSQKVLEGSEEVNRPNNKFCT
jgi:hypothetical protein